MLENVVSLTVMRSFLKPFFETFFFITNSLFLIFFFGISPNTQNLLILEVTFERVLAIGTPESSRFVTHFVNLSVPRKIFPSSLSDIRIHSEHFLRDHDEHETITPSAMSTLELVDLDKHLQDPVSFPYPVVIRQVSASSGHAVAVTVEGKALVWGEQRDRNFPLLGLGHDQRFKLTTPTEVFLDIFFLVFWGFVTESFLFFFPLFSFSFFCLDVHTFWSR